jgi:hypothetical protein
MFTAGWPNIISCWIEYAAGAEMAQILAMFAILNPSRDKILKMTTPFITILNLHNMLREFDSNMGGVGFEELRCSGSSKRSVIPRHG